MFLRAMVRPPSANFAEGLTTVDIGRPVYSRAIEQHEAYCRALEQCGLTVTRLEEDERYPDATFIEDTAVVTERGAILARPGAPGRREEVTGVRNALIQFFPELHSIREPGTLDGGDVCAVDDGFFIGVSERTNEAGAQQLAEFLSSFGYASRFVDIRGLNAILHLKSGLAYLGDNRLGVIEALRNRKEFRSYDRLPVIVGEEYAANCVRVNTHVLVAAGYPAFAGTLQEEGYETITLDMTEFRKMDGGLSCLSLRF